MRKIRRSTVLAALGIISTSCIVESSTIYTATLHNNTDHQIRVLPFHKGVVLPQDTLLLNGKQSLQIAYGSDRGISNQGGFNSDYFAGCDSVLVVYDDTISIVHYFYEPSFKSHKFYLYESLRNLLNMYSFEYYHKDRGRHARDAFYDYYFTEQDYLDAKD